MRVKVKMLGLLGAVVVLGAATAAEARRYERVDGDERGWEASESRPLTRRHRAGRVHGQGRASRMQEAQRITGGRYAAGPRPRAWCGWWMRTQRGGGPEFNLAWNWSRWGKSTEPKVGAVVVWRHHVGEITGRSKNGQWIVRSGNDGGRVRERPRSVAGAVFRI